MDLASHYRAVSAEFLALERRVRNLIGGAHYLTDGEWKESVLRAFIARHVPAHAPESVRNNRPVWYPNESKELSSVLDVSLATGEVTHHR